MMEQAMRLTPIVAALAIALASGAQAQSASHDAHSAPRAQAAPAASDLADGEVRKIDKAQGKLTLKHGPIANLEMPAMTMIFKVADPKMLDKLEVGDKVQFAAQRVNGAITVVAISPRK